MKFVTNTIHTGKQKSFADLVSDFNAKKNAGTVKTASAATVVKTARSDAKQEEGESSGQLDVEPLHQTGESTPQVKGKSGSDKDQKAGDKVVSSADGKVKEAECGICDKDNENNGPAEESGQTKADFPKLTNDPDAGKHRDGDGDQKKEANSANFGDKKAAPFGAKKEDGEDKSEKKEEKEASATSTKKTAFVVTANLDGKSKSWLKKYWGELYPSEYADAMLGDK